MSRLRDLVERLIPEGGVQDRAVKGSVWLFLDRGFGRTIHLLKLAVLARLLAPGDFGLMGIALLALYAIEKLSRLGFDEALIQRIEDDVDSYLDTVWVMKIVRGTALGLLMYLLAPVFASFFAEPRVTDLVRVLAALPVLRALFNPGILYFRKDLNFHKRLVFDVVGNVTNVAAALIFAYFSPTVWALVVGNLVEEVTKLGLSYVLHGYRPWPRFDLGQAREMFAYGKWLTASTGIAFVLNNGDDAFVGWFLGASALGFYQLAFRFGNAPATELTHVLSTALFPTFSKVQEDADRLRSAFTRSVQLVTLVSFPASVGIIVVAPVFVPVVLGSKWIPLVEELQILAAWGMVRSLKGIFGNLVQAVGRPDISTKVNLLRLVLLATAIWPATARFGTEGTAGAVAITAAATLCVYGYLTIREVGMPVGGLLAQLTYPLASALVMGAAVYWVRERPFVGSGAFELVALILIGVVTYGLATWLVAKLTGYDVLSTIASVAGSLR